MRMAYFAPILSLLHLFFALQYLQIFRETAQSNQHTCTAKDCESCCWLVSESSIPESLLGFAKEASERARLAGPPPTSSAFRLPETSKARFYKLQAANG